MKTIEFQHPHRKKHFEFFKNMNHPHFNICANVDITNFLYFLKQKNLPFTPSIVFVTTKVANSIPQFLQRIRGTKVVEHENVHPSFTVWTDVADVFSFCEVKFTDNYMDFIKSAEQKIAKMRTHPSFEDSEERDDYLFMSSIPWVSFTSFQHAMSYHPSDSVPRITWGKYFKEAEKIMMPVSVQVHHALVDGRHVGQYFMKLEEILGEPNNLI